MDLLFVCVKPPASPSRAAARGRHPDHLRPLHLVLLVVGSACPLLPEPLLRRGHDSTLGQLLRQLVDRFARAGRPLKLLASSIEVDEEGALARHNLDFEVLSIVQLVLRGLEGLGALVVSAVQGSAAAGLHNARRCPLGPVDRRRGRGRHAPVQLQVRGPQDMQRVLQGGRVTAVRGGVPEHSLEAALGQSCPDWVAA